MRIFLIRHGEAIKIGKDSVLTEVGLKQAKNVARILSSIPVSLIFTSDSTRARQTFEEYNKVNPSAKVETTSDLAEIYRVIVGGPEKEGTPKDREKKDRERADKFFKDLQNLKEENVAIFSHGNIIRYFISKSLGVDSKSLWEKMVISPGSISIIEVTKNKEIQVKAINLYEHQKEFLNDFFNGEIIRENYAS